MTLSPRRVATVGNDVGYSLFDSGFGSDVRTRASRQPTADASCFTPWNSRTCEGLVQSEMTLGTWHRESWVAWLEALRLDHGLLGKVAGLAGHSHAPK